MVHAGAQQPSNPIFLHRRRSPSGRERLVAVFADLEKKTVAGKLGTDVTIRWVVYSARWPQGGPLRQGVWEPPVGVDLSDEERTALPDGWVGGLAEGRVA